MSIILSLLKDELLSLTHLKPAIIQTFPVPDRTSLPPQKQKLQGLLLGPKRDVLSIYDKLSGKTVVQVLDLYFQETQLKAIMAHYFGDYGKVIVSSSPFYDNT